MSKMSELSLAVSELKRCGEALIGISESLADLFSSNEDARAAKQMKAETPASEKKPITLEAVRALLAEKSRSGIPPKFGNCSKSMVLISCRKSTLQNIRHFLRKPRCWEMGKQVAELPAFRQALREL